LIHYLSKIYFEIVFCQSFEYGIFILISALKLFNSKKNLPCVFERLTFEWRKKEYFRVEWSSPCHGNQQEFRYTCIRSDTLFRRKSPRRCVSSAICGCSGSGCSEESQVAACDATLLDRIFLQVLVEPFELAVADQRVSSQVSDH